MRQDPTTSVRTTQSMTSTSRPLVYLTRTGDTILALYNTTAGGSTGGKNGSWWQPTEHTPSAIDHNVGTKYLNKALGGSAGAGINTGFYVIPSISNATVVLGLHFATANDCPERDPISVTLEGSNSSDLDLGSSWTLIYNGSTGISASSDPGRMVYAPQQRFLNTVPYKSYRLLVTSKRGNDNCVQYSEAHIIGYVYVP